MTREQRRWLSACKRAGYTQVFFDPENNRLLPAYHDWVLEMAVDTLDAGYRPEQRVQKYLNK